MTRINLVDPEELSRQHLIAEYRELPRVFNLVRKAIARGESPDDKRNPSEYVLGAGHVRFFYNKAEFLAKRFALLVAEMKSRNYNTSWIAQDISDIPEAWKLDYIPTPYAICLNRQRIAERTGR